MTTYTLKDFKLIKIIGSGISSTVFAAEHQNNMYAIKAVRKEKTRFSTLGITEKNILKNVHECPFIVKFFCCFATDTRLCYVLEYAPGGDLSHYLQRNKYILPLDTIKFYAAELSLAIIFLHTKGIVHRDIKFKNILIDRDGHAKLTDFGSAVEQILEGKRRSIRGTLQFLAPEAFKREEYSYEVDWWSFGVCLYFMMYRQFPLDFGSELQSMSSMRIIYNNEIPFPESIPDSAVTILKGLLEKDPNKRLGKGGFEEIRCHPFLSTIDWQKIERKEIQPPLKIEQESSTDFRYFNPDNVQELHSLTKNDEVHPEEPIFKDFDYINPDWKN